MNLKEIKERFERRLLDEKETEFLLNQLEEAQKTLEQIQKDSEHAHFVSTEGANNFRLYVHHLATTSLKLLRGDQP